MNRRGWQDLQSVAWRVFRRQRQTATWCSRGSKTGPRRRRSPLRFPFREARLALFARPRVPSWALGRDRARSPARRRVAPHRAAPRGNLYYRSRGRACRRVPHAAFKLIASATRVHTRVDRTERSARLSLARDLTPARFRGAGGSARSERIRVPLRGDTAPRVPPYACVPTASSREFHAWFERDSVRDDATWPPAPHPVSRTARRRGRDRRSHRSRGSLISPRVRSDPVGSCIEDTTPRRHPRTCPREPTFVGVPRTFSCERLRGPRSC